MCVSGLFGKKHRQGSFSDVREAERERERERERFPRIDPHREDAIKDTDVPSCELSPFCVTLPQASS